jgi:hypothetical protein
MAPDPDALACTRTDRRDALKKIGAGAAIAWTAPIILSSPASAARGSCYPMTVVYTSLAPGPTSLGAASFFPFNLGTLGVSTPDYAGPLSPPDAPIDVLADDQSLGGVPALDQLNLNLQAGAIGDFHDVEFDFGTEVFGLTFTLLDIDRAAGFWCDEITLYAENSVQATNPVLLAANYTIANPTYVGQFNVVGGPGIATNGNAFRAVAEPAPGPGADNTGTDGNVTIAYPVNVGVTKVTVRYRAFAEGTQPQQVGITNLDFCAFLP